MARKVHRINLDGIFVELRLDVNGIRRLMADYPKQTRFEIVMGGVADLEQMISVLDAALTWNGNTNDIQDGAELYDLLIDEGYAGELEFGRLALDIAVASGMVKAKDADKIMDNMRREVDGVFDAQDADDRPTSA